MADVPMYTLPSQITLTKYYDINGNLINIIRNPWDISLSGDQTTIKVGSSIKLTALVSYNGTVQKDVMVLFEASGPSSWTNTQFTDASGKAYATFTPAGPGSYRVNATARKLENSTFKVLDSAYIMVNVQNKPISVEVGANPPSVNVNADSEVTVNVKDFTTKSPVSGAIVSLNASGGRLKPMSGATGANGIFSATFTPDAAGSYTIGVTVTATGYDTWVGVATVEGSSRPLNASIVVSPQPVVAGSEATVTVTTTDGASPVSGVDVKVNATGGSIRPASAKTGPDGTYAFKFTADQTGSYTLTATANAEGYVQAQSSATVTVEQASNLLMYVCPGAICLGIILIIFLILLLRWLRSDLKIIPKRTKMPADGTTKVPVRVQFVNGLGMVKKMGRDTEVELESTAGTIKGVVVPGGREYVDAELTTSKEFGPVTITGKSGGKITRAVVDFTLENGSLEVSVQPGTIPADGRSAAAITIRVRDEKGNFVAPVEEKLVDVKSTLGTVQGPVKMPARTASASTNIISGEVSGTAAITATMGGLRGEGKVTFEGLPKRFCMHCGTPMSLEAAECPKCGQTPPSGVDTKQCPSCGTVVPEAAKFCYHCGARQPEKK